jgi:protein SCO1/2
MPHKIRDLDTTRKTVLAVLGGIVAALVLIGIAVLPRLGQIAPPEVSIGGPFTLVDQTGKTVTDADYRGKLMLIYFGYTFCPDVCPTSLGVLAKALDMLSPQDLAQVVPIFITVDPERDTVDQMAQYVSAFHPALQGLTGSPEQVQAAVKAYRVYAKRSDGETDNPNYTMDHSSILYLMGKDGKFIAHYGHTASAQDIAEGVKKHL